MGRRFELGEPWDLLDWLDELQERQKRDAESAKFDAERERIRQARLRKWGKRVAEYEREHPEAREK